MNIAQLIDQTNIDPDATEEDIIKSCEEALSYQFRGLCLNPEWIKTAKKILKNTGIKIIVLVDPPVGISTTKQRIKICQQAIQDGADEIDVVVNLVDIKTNNYRKILKDLKKITKIGPTKVIIGSGYLTNDEIKRISEIITKTKAFCLKTATIKDPLDRTELEEKAKHLKIMRQAAPKLLIKASGGIDSFTAVQKMIAAGADIIGTSSGVDIIRQSWKKNTI
jgi:deoxyribose-phosphate aldolase